MDDDSTKNNDLTRREFLKRTGVAAAAIGGVAATVGLPPAEAADDKNKMPTRVLGKTGRTVSLLGFGGGSQFIANSDEVAQVLLERAIALGIT